MSQAVFVPIKHKFNLPDSQRNSLRARLEKWREEHRIATRGEFSLMSSKVDLPDSILNKLLDHGGDFLRVDEVTPETIRKVVRWDLASPSDFQEVAAIISSWRMEAALEITPTSAVGRRKKKRKTRKTQVVDNNLTPRATPLETPGPSPRPSPQRPFQTNSHPGIDAPIQGGQGN